MESDVCLVFESDGLQAVQNLVTFGAALFRIGDSYAGYLYAVDG